MSLSKDLLKFIVERFDRLNVTDVANQHTNKNTGHMNSILSTLLSLISIISPIILFGTCCYFLAKKNVVEAILMTIGSGIGLLIHLLYLLLPLWLSSRNIPYTEISKY